VGTARFCSLGNLTGQARPLFIISNYHIGAGMNVGNPMLPSIGFLFIALPACMLTPVIFLAIKTITYHFAALFTRKLAL
jgi:hypothetical protein